MMMIIPWFMHKCPKMVIIFIISILWSSYLLPLFLEYSSPSGNYYYYYYPTAFFKNIFY